VDILTCEIEGIVLGLELVNRYFNERGNNGKSESVYILSDCTMTSLHEVQSTTAGQTRKIERFEDNLLKLFSHSI